MSGVHDGWKKRGGLGLLLAVLALVAIVGVPPGYMTEAGPGGPSLVICSGHGPVTLALDAAGHPSKAPKHQPDTPCAFAGHGVAGAPAPAVVLARTVTPLGAAPVLIPADLAPGRGLAAPPPPAQGPPADLI